MPTMNFCSSALSVIETEAQAIFELTQRVDETFHNACEILFTCEGRVVVTGIGKSGHVANKIAATFASTGTPAFFMHPAEASHGDLGMLTAKDAVVAISNSGNTHEILALLPQFKRLDISLISLTGNPGSTLAKMATVNLDLRVDKEACPLNLAPTTSTTTALVMGDALAIALLEARGFTANDFAQSHPGGILGNKSFITVGDLIEQSHALPIVHEDTSISLALKEVNEKKLGMTCVVDNQNSLVGIYTDGDIRRTLIQAFDIQNTPIKAVMTPNGKTIKPESLAAEALAMMQKYAITSLVITDNAQKPVSILHIHDLLRAGII